MATKTIKGWVYNDTLREIEETSNLPFVVYAEALRGETERHLGEATPVTITYETEAEPLCQGQWRDLRQVTGGDFYYIVGIHPTRSNRWFAIPLSQMGSVLDLIACLFSEDLLLQGKVVDIDAVSEGNTPGDIRMAPGNYEGKK